MTTLNFKQPYGVVYGHDDIRYTQNGKNFDSQGKEVGEKKPASVAKVQDKVVTSKLENAKAFLTQILSGNPLSKSVIYKEVESNNYVWNDVRDAAVELGIVKFTQKNLEMWKLPEGVSA
jgi:hypothetical protein